MLIFSSQNGGIIKECRPTQRSIEVPHAGSTNSGKADGRTGNFSKFKYHTECANIILYYCLNSNPYPNTNPNPYPTPLHLNLLVLPELFFFPELVVPIKWAVYVDTNTNQAQTYNLQRNCTLSYEFRLKFCSNDLYFIIFCVL